MTSTPDTEARLAVIAEIQRRARVALLAGAIASSVICTALWNSYLSWDRRWAYEMEEPVPWGQRQLLQQQIRSWIETNTVAVSLLGIRVSVSDAAVLGSIALIILAYYMCMALRKENEEVALLLRHFTSSQYDLAEKKRVLDRIQSTTLFLRRSTNDEPFTTVGKDRETMDQIPLSHFVLRVLTYLPAITIWLVIASDIYYAYGYESPWMRNTIPLRDALPPSFVIQLVVMDLFATLCALLAWRYCKRAAAYRVGTQGVLETFESHLSAGSVDTAE